MPLAISAGTQKGLRSLRAQAALFERFRAFDRSMRRLGSDPADPVPFTAVAELFAHWGDPLPQSAETYVRSCLAHAREASGPILQCGSSIMTLVLGALCSASEDRNRQLWCLEHDPHWANTLRSWLTQYRIGSAHVITSRPHLFDGYVWYAVDTARLPGDLSLVFCDGARSTPSGIVGTLQRIHPRLAPEFTVLARRVTRDGDLKQLQLWAKTRDAACVVVDRPEGFVKVTRRTRTPAAGDEAGHPASAPST